LYAQLNATATFELHYVVKFLCKILRKSLNVYKNCFRSKLSHDHCTQEQTSLPRPMCCDSCHIITLCVCAS